MITEFLNTLLQVNDEVKVEALEIQQKAVQRLLKGGSTYVPDSSPKQERLSKIFNGLWKTLLPGLHSHSLDARSLLVELFPEPLLFKSNLNGNVYALITNEELNHGPVTSTLMGKFITDPDKLHELILKWRNNELDYILFDEVEKYQCPITSDKVF